MRPTRRLVVQHLLTAASAPLVLFSGSDPDEPVGSLSGGARVRGLLMGGLLGDALGGPIEFSESPLRTEVVCDARSWPDDQLVDSETRKRLADSLVLADYRKLRPDAAAYGPWLSNAPAGTVTDDSRHKLVLIRAIRRAVRLKRAVQASDIAQAFLEFQPAGQVDDSTLAALCEEGLREYRYASRWLLGERDLKLARPIERLWAGVNNCSGQMMLPPLAACYAGRPEAAYRAAWKIDFIDSNIARDIAAAIVAGLAAALDPELDAVSADQRWAALLNAMQQVDPFGYRDVPYAGRQLDRWMAAAQQFAKDANGSPQRLYRLLETQGKPEYWWDAHFCLLVPLAILHLCEFDPLSSLHLTLDFGHDTDSYAQLLGCMIGAVHGEDVFPEMMRRAVYRGIQRDFDEDATRWPQLLQDAARIVRL